MLLRRLFAYNRFPNLQLKQLSTTCALRGTVPVEKQFKPYRSNSENKHNTTPKDPKSFPSECDVAIIGGGGMGSSAAYFLKNKSMGDLNVVVIEKDSTYSRASTALSAGCLRQQFTVDENVLMSQFGAKFLRTFHKEIGNDFDPNFQRNGNLYLVNKKNADRLWRAVERQNLLGVHTQLLFPHDLKERFPWINLEGVYLASYGDEDEGWFDPWALLMGLRKKAKSLGAQYVEGEVVDFETEHLEGGSNAVTKVVVRTADNEQKSIKCGKCVLAAGANSGKIAEKAGIGTGTGLLETPLPIEPRKRYVYVFKSDGTHIPPPSAPLVLDTTQMYFRREGATNFICGRSPSDGDEPEIDNLDVDMDYFAYDMWPDLATRVPAFQTLEMAGAWAGYYDYNSFDQNGVVGRHPAFNNFYIAAGFSGHGVQKVPAVGQAIAELIVDGYFSTIDLNLLSFNRIIKNEPIMEMAIA